MSSGGHESTGVSLKPISHVWNEVVAVWVAKSQDSRQRPGQKTDEWDATWMAELLAHGLIKPSIVSPPAMRAFCDLTRTRVSLAQTHI